MSTFAEAFTAALALLAGRDAELWGIIGLSLRVSGLATLCAFVLGAPFAGLLATSRFPGRRALLLVANAALGLPPVVVGLVVYLLLSRSGPLGALGWLFTAHGMVLAQTILALPLVIALAHRALAAAHAEHGDQLRIDGARPAQLLRHLLLIARAPLVTVLLAAFGRCIAEVGAILVVGGNIRGETRTMTTAIALETQKGDLALALGLGMVLLVLVLTVSAVALWLERRGR